ncbi:MAG TPA: hypothetical protein VKB08_15490 [Bradyrhizobium sp.]|nr:hypothetical protein [Bradyrhizobium sp.]
MDQRYREFRQTCEIAVADPGYEHEVSPLDVSSFCKRGQKRIELMLRLRGRPQKSDAAHTLLSL